jgi:hypothetical protein
MLLDKVAVEAGIYIIGGKKQPLTAQQVATSCIVSRTGMVRDMVGWLGAMLVQPYRHAGG